MATTSSKPKRRWLPGFAVLAGALLSAAAALYGCGEVDTVLLVRVEGAATGTIMQFEVQAQVGEETRTLRVPEQKAPISLPTSFTIEIPSRFDGAFRVEVKALNNDDEVIGEGEASAPATQTIVDVVLRAVMVGGENGKKDASVAPKEDTATPSTDAFAYLDAVTHDAGGLVDAADASDAARLDAAVKEDAPAKLDAPPKEDAMEKEDAMAKDDAADEEAKLDSGVDTADEGDDQNMDPTP